MPDLDYIHTTVHPLWSDLVNKVAAGQPLDVVSRLLIHKLANMLRKSGGVAQLAATCFAINCRDDSDTGLFSFSNNLAEIVRNGRKMRGERQAQSLCRVALQFAAENRRDVTNRDVAHAFLKQLLDQSIFSAPAFACGTIGDISSAHEYAQKLLDINDAKLWQIAEQLERDPSAKTLIAPAMPLQRQSTRELLREEVG